MKDDYRKIIASVFESEIELNNFLKAIENDTRLSDKAYYKLRHEALKEYYR